MAQLPDKATVVLSHFQADLLLEARRRGRRECEVSLDLNLTRSPVRLSAEGVDFREVPGSETEPASAARPQASWKAIARIAKSANGCFLLRRDGFWKIQNFSALTHRPYSLMPTAGAPTVLNAGFTMHRIKGVTPEEDTRRKLEVLGRITGPLLDTNTGLGYTAIEAASQASSVVTIELDPAMLELAAYNPWSRPLFENPAISQLTGDALQVMAGFHPGSFGFLIHDPPTLSLAGELYSLECYKNLHRLLSSGGKLLHYAGNPDTRQGARIIRRVARGLREVGFRKVSVQPQAFAVFARK